MKFYFDFFKHFNSYILTQYFKTNMLDCEKKIEEHTKENLIENILLIKKIEKNFNISYLVLGLFYVKIL